MASVMETGTRKDKTMSNFTIETTKGSMKGTLEEVCAWQAEHQGSFATVTAPDGTSVDVADVDFDDEDLDQAVAQVARLLRQARGEVDMSDLIQDIEWHGFSVIRALEIQGVK